MAPLWPLYCYSQTSSPRDLGSKLNRQRSALPTCLVCLKCLIHHCSPHPFGRVEGQIHGFSTVTFQNTFSLHQYRLPALCHIIRIFFSVNIIWLKLICSVQILEMKSGHCCLVVYWLFSPIWQCLSWTAAVSVTKSRAAAVNCSSSVLAFRLYVLIPKSR